MKTLILPLTDPIGALWLLMLGVLAFWIARRRWSFVISMAVPVLLLWVAGTNVLPSRLVPAAERPYAQSLPAVPADAVLVLGGGFYASAYDPYGIALAGGASRIVTGIELARRGITTNLVLGGSIPVDGQPESVSSKLQTWVESWHLQGISVTNLGNCLNTHDEALAFKQMNAERRWKRVYLVTSALHMPRSVATFEKQGISVIPVACDFRGFGIPRGPIQIFPSHGNLANLSAWMHEWIGWWVYRFKGWI